MSDPATPPPAAPAGVDQWVLRAPAGQVYGPVTFDTIRAWAAQNRFTAGYAISADKTEWRPVESVPELGMDWFVEPGDGSRYGPFHPLALLDYIREGAVPPETRVVHKSNGGVARAYQVLLEAFVDAIDQTGEVQSELFRQIQALQERLEERDRWFAGETRALQEERARRQELELAMRRLEEQGAQAGAVREKLERAEAELARVRKEAEVERRAAGEVRARLEQEYKEGRAEADRRIRELERNLEDVRLRLEAAEREKEKVSARLAGQDQAWQAERAALTEQARSAEEALRLGREEGIRQRREDEERLRRAEGLAAKAGAETSRAEAELAALQGRFERLRREAEEARDASRTADEVRGEAQTLAASLREAEADRAFLKAALEQEKRAVREAREEAAARQEAEGQRREALEALGRDAAALRRENASLQRQLDSTRMEVEESARTEKELLELRQSVQTLRSRAVEAEGERLREKTESVAALERGALATAEAAARAERLRDDVARLEGERERQAAQAGVQAARGDRLEQELEEARARIRVLEQRLAERPPAEPRKSAWTVPPATAGAGPETVVEPEPPPRKGPNLAGLEARAQAELKAWQEKKQAGPKGTPPPKGKSWLPWK